MSPTFASRPFTSLARRFASPLRSSRASAGAATGQPGVSRTPRRVWGRTPAEAFAAWDVLAQLSSSRRRRVRVPRGTWPTRPAVVGPRCPESTRSGLSGLSPVPAGTRCASRRPALCGHRSAVTGHAGDDARVDRARCSGGPGGCQPPTGVANSVHEPRARQIRRREQLLCIGRDHAVRPRTPRRPAVRSR